MVTQGIINILLISLATIVIVINRTQSQELENLNESGIVMEQTLGLITRSTTVLVTTRQASTLTEVVISFPRNTLKIKKKIDDIVKLNIIWL